jgi:hypothetical protein
MADNRYIELFQSPFQKYSVGHNRFFPDLREKGAFCYNSGGNKSCEVVMVVKVVIFPIAIGAIGSKSCRS